MIGKSKRCSENPLTPEEIREIQRETEGNIQGPLKLSDVWRAMPGGGSRKRRIPVEGWTAD